jgi:hypothetical protein
MRTDVELAVCQKREALCKRLKEAVGADQCKGSKPEELIDGLFALFQRATKHAIAHVMSEHGIAIVTLMSMPYARNKED